MRDNLESRYDELSFTSRENDTAGTESADCYNNASNKSLIFLSSK